jgi:hypothetical protein
MYKIKFAFKVDFYEDVEFHESWFWNFKENELYKKCEKDSGGTLSDSFDEAFLAFNNFKGGNFLNKHFYVAVTSSLMSIGNSVFFEKIKTVTNENYRKEGDVMTDIDKAMDSLKSLLEQLKKQGVKL